MKVEGNTLVRQWALLRMLPREPVKCTARELAERLGTEGFAITKRTVERDLQNLSGIFPLVADDREKPYGWCWAKDAVSFNLPALSSTEALALKMLETHLKPLLPASTLEALAPHFKAATARLAEGGGKGKAASWSQKVRIVQPTQPLLAPKADAEVQRVVSEALLADQQVRISYRKRGEAEAVEYEVNPLALVQRGPVTYLICTLFRYQDAVRLPLHRVLKAEVLDAPPRRPSDFDLDEYLASGALGFGGEEPPIRLEAIFANDAAEHLHETPLSEDQVLKPADKGRTRLTATVPYTSQLVWWLLGFGEGVEVVRPAKLRAVMAGTARAMTRLYQKV